MTAARLPCTFINVAVAYFPGKSRVAIAREGVETVGTDTISAATAGGAIINVELTFITLPSSVTFAPEISNQVNACAVVAAPLRLAIVNIRLA